MTALSPGNIAPSVSLQATDGVDYKLSDALSKEPVVVLAFYKVGCPVCQFAFPFLERLHRNYPQVPMWGVSQDDVHETKSFATEYGVTFPMILDSQLASTVDYGLTNVPSIFAVAKDGKIAKTIVGFAKRDLEELNQMMAESSGEPLKTLFTPDDDVPELRPG